MSSGHLFPRVCCVLEPSSISGTFLVQLILKALAKKQMAYVYELNLLTFLPNKFDFWSSAFFPEPLTKN